MTINELASMLHNLERSMKKEVFSMRSELAHVLQRVEDSKQWLDHHHTASSDLQTQVQRLAMAHHMAMYKLEDQENCNRMSNLRIRGLPETMNYDNLASTKQVILIFILGKQVNDPLHFNHVHRALLP